MIDWELPIYFRGDDIPLEHRTTVGAGDRPFHAFTYPGLPNTWHYYNQDGTPFGNGTPISNRPADDPRQRTLHLPDPEQERMEANPIYGVWG